MFYLCSVDMGVDSDINNTIWSEAHCAYEVDRDTEA